MRPRRSPPSSILAAQIRASTLATKRQALDGTIDRVPRWEARLAGSPDLLNARIESGRNFHGLSTEDPIRFTALIIESFAGIEATLEAAKFCGVKPETVGAVRGMIHNLSRNEGVREYWEVNGQHAFAIDFVRSVDAIFEEAERRTVSDRPGLRGVEHPRAASMSRKTRIVGSTCSSDRISNSRLIPKATLRLTTIADLAERLRLDVLSMISRMRVTPSELRSRSSP